MGFVNYFDRCLIQLQQDWKLEVAFINSMALDFISKLRCNKFQSHTQSNTDNLRFHVAGSKLRFGRCPQIKHKQALHLTRKLQQRTNWKVNLWLCELATALDIENWSVQVVCLADLFSLSVYLIHSRDKRGECSHIVTIATDSWHSRQKKNTCVPVL